MRNSVFEVRLIAGALGAEVHGVDLAEINDEDFADVHKAFLDHSVIFFRNQKLMPPCRCSLRAASVISISTRS
jgi:taurine dioxygenase